ncbi:MAG: leucine--tRNA ligase [Candidatus Hodarchaeota archaeon]
MVDWRPIEAKWQKKWSESKLFEADPDGREKIFATFPIPYMNGPFHLGHALTCSRVDIYARFKRMQGYNVLFPFAFHATGEPIAGVAERVRKGDQDQIDILIRGGVAEADVKEFKDPKYIINYYRKGFEEALKGMGYSIDWRRSFTTIDPPFNKFIEWQYSTLHDRGYVGLGTHPVIWCPNCKSPTGDHDRLVGEGISPVEYIILKFGYDDAWLVMATLRPETIYGVVNVWVNPSSTLVLAEVDGENWIMSKEAAGKLKEQTKKLKVTSEFRGSELIGRYCTNPVLNNDIPILPADFVDPGNATGIVMSVPSHAPYDWLSLRDLQHHPEELERFGLSPDVMDTIKPISLIKTPGLGEHPSLEIVELMRIKDQNDPKADLATKQIYKKEFHRGILKENTGKYAGIPVRQIKDKLIQDFRAQGIADSMWETADKVVCRCNTQCIVKILENQWFLKYGDLQWKSKSEDALENTMILPEEARSAFEYTIDWLSEKACVRRTGLGTKLPWDPQWIVETLSDSTIYMSFYTVVKFIYQNNIPAEKLSARVFDYIFLGKGNSEEVSNKAGLDPQVLKSMREEFLYWYPVDLRNSAKELIYNHLTFYIFQHVAIFPKELWPGIIGVNGMLNIEGISMSKSRGIFTTIREVLKKYGADATRIGLAYSSEGMDDPDWRAKDAEALRDRLDGLYDFATGLPRMDAKYSNIDFWLISKIHSRIRSTTEHYEKIETRSALQDGLFNLYNDIRWYLRRADSYSDVIKQAVETLIKLVAPVVPHISEEIWEKLGHKEFISTSKWPGYDEKKMNKELDMIEELILKVLEDSREIIKVLKIKKPKELILFVAPSWKYKIHKEARESTENLIERIMKKPEIKKHGSKAVEFAKKLMKTPSLLPILSSEREYKALKEAKAFFERESKAQTVTILRAEEAKHRKAEVAEPGRPGIHITV